MEHHLKHYIIYECEACGWKAGINEMWADLKPKVCANKKCGTSFLADPEKLIIHPAKDSLKKSKTKKKTITKKKSSKKRSSRKKKSKSE